MFDKGQEWYQLGKWSQALSLICAHMCTCLLIVLLLFSYLAVSHVAEAPVCHLIRTPSLSVQSLIFL